MSEHRTTSEHLATPEYRRIPPSDLASAIDNFERAFPVSAGTVESYRSWIDKGAFRGLYRQGELLCSCAVLRADMWVGGKVITGRGVAAVGTPPEHRRQGHVRELIRRVLDEFHAEGVILSSLFPFSYDFYRRFGYEICEDFGRYTVQSRALAGVPRAPGQVKPVGQGDLPLLMGIYDQWARRQNGALVRDETHWRTFSPLFGGIDFRGGYRYFAHVYFNPAGEPRGYVFWRHGDRLANVPEFIYLDAEARHGLLGLLRQLDAQQDNVRLKLPEDDRLPAQIDPWDRDAPALTMAREAGAMVRLVDVAEALESRGYPAGAEANLTIEVDDPFAEWNRGLFRWRVRNGGGEVERLGAVGSVAASPRAPSAEAPDLRLSVGHLAQLYMGYLKPGEAVELGLIEVSNPTKLPSLSAALAGPRPFMVDYY